MTIRLEEIIPGIIAPRPLTRLGSPLILICCLLMVVLAVLLFIWPLTIGATPLLAAAFVFHLTDKTHSVPDGHSGLILGLIIAVTTLMAFVGTVCRIGWPRMFLLVPQQFLLGAMAAGGFWAAWQGSYLDATPVFWSHILADQLAWSALFLFHGVGIYRRTGQVN